MLNRLLIFGYKLSKIILVMFPSIVIWGICYKNGATIENVGIVVTGGLLIGLIIAWLIWLITRLVSWLIFNDRDKIIYWLFHLDEYLEG